MISSASVFKRAAKHSEINFISIKSLFYDLLGLGAYWRVKAFGHLPGASPTAMRRDFDQLADSGELERILRAMRVARGARNGSFSLQSVPQSITCSAIAEQARQLLRVEGVIFIDGGDDVLHLIYLPTLITISNRHVKWEAWLIGGATHHSHDRLKGSGTLHSLDFYYAH